MRVGVLSRGLDELDWVAKLGFKSTGWLRFFQSPAADPQADWKSYVDKYKDAAGSRGIRVSAIGALYKNPLDPKQTDYSREVFKRAILVAARMGVRTVCGFPGAVIELEINERGGNPVYKPFENYIPQLCAFWDPIGKFAADNGVRIAFEPCPQGTYFLPIMGYNMLAKPAMWERFWNESKCADNFGIEWDASHLICQFIDPVTNIHKYGRKIFHVHAKDAYINHRLMAIYGICHPGVAEHRHPGLGQANWAEIVHALLRAGYDSDLNIEPWHDPVYRDHDAEQPEDVRTGLVDFQKRQKLEAAGLMIAKKTLEQYTAGTE